MRVRRTRFKITNIIIGAVITGVIALAVYNMRDILFGSPLVVETAMDGHTLSDPFLPLSGNARHAREISINGRPVAIDRSGNFLDGALLSPGYNIVEVALKDQFGKEKVKTYHYVLNPTAAVAKTSPAIY